jgi:hypothetical protein
VCCGYDYALSPDGATYSGLSTFDDGDYALSGSFDGIRQAVREIY